MEHLFDEIYMVISTYLGDVDKVYEATGDILEVLERDQLGLAEAV